MDVQRSKTIFIGKRLGAFKGLDFDGKTYNAIYKSMLGTPGMDDESPEFFEESGKPIISDVFQVDPAVHEKVKALYHQFRPEIQSFATFDLNTVLWVLKKLPMNRRKIDLLAAYGHLRRVQAFESLSKYVMIELIASMYIDELDEGACVFKQGDVGTAWYVILYGGVEICISSTGDVADMVLIGKR
jgi:hypothetical protein